MLKKSETDNQARYGVAMARVKLQLPDTFLYSTDLRVRIGDINHASHVGNDAILKFLNEARVRCPVLKPPGSPWCTISSGIASFRKSNDPDADE